MKNNNYYYDIRTDIDKAPDAWCYIIYGGRNMGKTYSALRYCIEEQEKFVFIKRTNDDVNLICSGNNLLKGSRKKTFSIDLSPFKSLNRDMGWTYAAYGVHEGLGAFYSTGDEGPEGSPAGYIISLNSVTKFKGFDMSECGIIIFDEFVPKIYDRIRKGEGEQLLDLYKTVGRDREHRGLHPIKLICLANADNISCPVTQVLEITDLVANMAVQGSDYIYQEERGIVIHRVMDNADFRSREERSAIYKAMAGTKWAAMALDNDFGFNDLSNIRKLNVKGFQPWVKVIYQRRDHYIFYNPEKGCYYVTRTRSNADIPVYDLDLDNDRLRFFYDCVIQLQEATMHDLVRYESYSLYDVVMNYKKFYK